MYYYIRTVRLDDEGVEIILRETTIKGSHVKETINIKGSVTIIKQFIISEHKLK